MTRREATRAMVTLSRAIDDRRREWATQFGGAVAYASDATLEIVTAEEYRRRLAEAHKRLAELAFDLANLGVVS